MCSSINVLFSTERIWIQNNIQIKKTPLLKVQRHFRLEIWQLVMKKRSHRGFDKILSKWVIVSNQVMQWIWAKHTCSSWSWAAYFYMMSNSAKGYHCCKPSESWNDRLVYDTGNPAPTQDTQSATPLPSLGFTGLHRWDKPTAASPKYNQ